MLSRENEFFKVQKLQPMISLYFSNNTYHLVTQFGHLYRIATIDSSLKFTDDPNLYSKDPFILLPKVATALGVLGLFKNTIILVTANCPCALLGGHFVYHIDSTTLIPLFKSADFKSFSTVPDFDFKNFYYSYTYDLTHSLQANLYPKSSPISPNLIFSWNHHLIPINSPFYLSVIHGFVDQSSILVFGREITLTLIARRSRCYAGPRYLKRGTSDLGFCANDVETEQIVFSTSFFHQGGYSSFLQHRASIPLFWTQEATSMQAKPQIELAYLDPFYTATARHFDNLFARYGSPITVLNLIKVPLSNIEKGNGHQRINFVGAFCKCNYVLEPIVTRRTFNQIHSLGHVHGLQK
jgi:hypothetical protein